MNISKCQFLIFALFLVNLLEEVKSLRCFTCMQEFSEDCRDPFVMENTALAGECIHPDEVCLKHIMEPTYMYKENIKRGCVRKNYCEYLETSQESCFTCNTHLCNTSSSIGLNMALATFIFGYVLQKFL